MMIPMITNTGENEGRAVVHEDGSKGKLGKTFADESFEVIFDGGETITFAEPDREFFGYADEH